jgi:hypothetical protein
LEQLGDFSTSYDFGWMAESNSLLWCLWSPPSTLLRTSRRYDKACIVRHVTKSTHHLPIEVLEEPLVTRGMV